jgi:hypothetical protein
MTEIKIYRLSCRLTSKGFEEDTIVWDAVEKNKTYTLTRIDKDGDKSVRHKKKSQIGFVDTGMFYNSIERVEFITFCFAEQIEEFRPIIKENVVKCVLKMQEHLEKLINNIYKTA